MIDGFTKMYHKYVVDCNEVIFIGDLHGNFDSIPYFIKQKDINGAALVFCGDIGMGFSKPEYYHNEFVKIDKVCKERNVHIYMFRGNHDDPSYFDGNPLKLDDDIEYEPDNIHLIEDYSVIQANMEDGNKHYILCVGGAISIDRTYRRKKNEVYVKEYMLWHDCSEEEAEKKATKIYWENEPPVFRPESIEGMVEFKIDVVATHTAPSFVYPYTKDGIKYWIENDLPLGKDCDDERKCMDDIYNKLKECGHPVKEWIYGHFHTHEENDYEGVHFTLLDMDRMGRYDIKSLKK